MGHEIEGTALGRAIGEPIPIRKTQGIRGGEACIRDTRHTVSGLVQWRRLGLADRQIRERHPDLSQNDLDMAWAYYDRNREEIDRAVLADEEA